MSIKSLVLNKGWAGTTLNRQDTADRVNQLIRPLIELMYQYDSVLTAGASKETDAGLREMLPNLRADIGKLSETIHSSGGIAYSGTDLEPSTYASGDRARLRENEEAFGDLLDAESKIEHQIRTRAVLGAVASNSKLRLALLHQSD